MFQKKILFSLAAISLLSSTVYATAPNPCCFCPHFYAGIEVGRSYSGEAFIRPQASLTDPDANWTIPENTDWSRTIGTSGDYGAFVGYQLNPNVGLQLTFDHRNSFSWTVPVNAAASFPDEPFEEYSLHDIEISTLFADLKLAPSVCWNGFVPFVKAGIGWSRNKSGELRDVNIPNGFFNTEVSFDTHVASNTENDFAWNAGVGVDYYFNRCISATFAYRFVDVGELKTGTRSIDPIADPGGVDNNVPFKSEHIFLSEFVAAVTYHFG